MRFDDPVVAGQTLVRTGIQSADYVAGVSGWAIFRNGNVEFGNGTFRGSFSAGGGAVTLNSTGLVIQGLDGVGATLRYFISTNAGFFGRRVPDDGAYTAMQINSNAQGGPSLFQRPPEPTANGYTWAASSQITSEYVANPSISVGDHGLLRIKSPQVTGKSSSYFEMHGQSGASNLNDSSMQLYMRRLTKGDLDMGGGIIASVSTDTSSPGIGTTETGVLTATTQQNMLPDTVYEIKVFGNMLVSVAGNNPSIRIRKTSTAGQQIAFARKVHNATTATEDGFFSLFKTDTTSPGSVTFALTLQAGAAGTVATSASAAQPFGFYVTEKGSPANFGVLPILT